MKKNLKIGVAFHKNYPINNYIKDRNIYIPIIHGENPNPNIFYNDNEGENCAGLNPYINEITQLYWFYYHLDQFNNPDYIGLANYRRYLYFNQKDLDQNTIIATKFDLSLKNYNIFTQLMSHQLSIEQIKEIAEFYLTAFFDEQDNLSYYMQLSTLYPCNLFIMPRKIFEKYIKMILFLIRETSWFLSYEPSIFQPNKRSIGMFIERMTSYFIWKQGQEGVNIKDVPIIVPKEELRQFKTFKVGNFNIIEDGKLINIKDL